MAPVYEWPWPERPAAVEQRAAGIAAAVAGVYAAWCRGSASTRPRGAATASGRRRSSTPAASPTTRCRSTTIQAFRQRVYDLGRRWTVPLVTIDDEPIGGYDELAALDRSGLLAERLAA